MALYSLAQTAAFAGMSYPTLMRRFKAGNGPVVQKVGKVRVVTEHDLQSWLLATRLA